MNLLRAAEFKVGLLVLGVASLIAFMSLQVSEDPSYLGRSNEAWFVVSDANGLVKNSGVKMAGIPVGVIKNITLQDGMARVDMTLRPDVKLYVSAVVKMKSQGILGDKHVEIYPGSPTDPPLPRKGQILNVQDKGNLDNVINQVGDIAANLKDVSQALKEAVAEDGTRKHILGRIVSNIERLTQDVSDLTSANKDKLNQIVDEVHGITKTLDEALNNDSEEGFKKTWKRTLARIDSTMKNIDEISGKINRGEGTIGKLINDEQTVEELNTAIDGVNGFLDTAGKTQTGIDFNSVYLGNIGAKSAVGLRIQPGLDRYYYLGIIDDPIGAIETTQTVTTGTATGDITETKTYKNKVKFTALFAKNFYDFTIRGGLIENSGGVGFDYMLYRDKLKFSIEAYEFSKLNLRSQLQFNLYKGVYVMGGMSDILDKSSKRAGYLGAGLLLTNDDLKMLMTKMPL